MNVPSYQPLDPYNSVTDNLPITGLIERIFLVNNQVDVLTTIMNSAIGTQGTLANRLNQSLNPDGSIKTVAIDNALHSIAQHVDTANFVRMTFAERSKLSFIANDATALQLQVQTPSGIVGYINQAVLIEPSDSITWRVSGNTIFADTNFPASVRHTHHYGVVAVPTNLVFPDYQHYFVSSVASPYQQGSLRVYVNGVRLNENVSVYVPTGQPGIVSWQLFSYSEDVATGGIVTTGKFTMSSPIPSTANIVVDFDVLF